MSVCVTIRTKKELKSEDILKTLADCGEKIVVVSDFPSIHFGTAYKSLRGIEVNDVENGYEVRVCSFANEDDLKLYGKTIDVVMQLSGGKAYFEDDEADECFAPIERFGLEWINEQINISLRMNSVLVKHRGSPIVMDGLFASFCFGPSLIQSFDENDLGTEACKTIQSNLTNIQWFLADKKDTSTRMAITHPEEENERPLSVSMISVKDGKVSEFDYVSYADLFCMMNFDTDEMTLIHFSDAWKIADDHFQMLDDYQFLRIEEFGIDDFEKMRERAKLYEVDNLFKQQSFPGEGYQDSQRTFILMWNPDISSVKLEDHNKDIPNMVTGYFNWSVFEHEKAHKGDRFFLVRCGEGKTGVVMSGFFDTNPYLGKDWSGRGRKVYYMDLVLNAILNPEVAPMVTTGELQDAIPDFNWHGGSSGRLLTEKQAKTMENIWRKYLLSIEDKIDGFTINANRIAHLIGEDDV